MNHKNESYEPPTLKAWGTVEELTAVGNTDPGTDMKDGSVNPPGHDKGGGPGSGSGGGPPYGEGGKP
ncbi:lasso RiPP family leader peptide-containing protein [Salinibacter ruber]|jgi:hypothetical protein|uniref:lasso RiPP family leader peptide-containing protein n=1 Tax=Salinibacter TaxID=146918 RepID=UPI000E57F292